MADSITVDHGSVSITTNTASEADLRTEMEAPAAPTTPAPAGDRPTLEVAPLPAPVRDDKGRFAKTEPATPPVETPTDPEPAADTEPPARGETRRREDLPRHNPIARLNQALAQKAEADRRAAALEAELARYRQPAAATPPPPANVGTHVANHPPFTAPAIMADGYPPELQWDAYVAAHPDHPDPYTSFQDAKVDWRFTQQQAHLFAQWEAAQIEKQRAESFKARLAEGRTRIPDWDQALTEADTLGLQISAVMEVAIAESPHTADLVHYLATHPEECTQLAEESQATPVAAATVMRRLLESHLASPAAPVTNGTGSAARATVSTAKPPVMPVGSSPVVSDEPPGDHASAAEHARYWNRRLKVPGTR